MEFTEKFARLDDSNDDDVNIAEDDELRRQRDHDFIDDNQTSFQDHNRIKNVTHDLQNALQDKSMWQEFEYFDPEHFVPGCFDDVEYEFGTFNNFEKKLKSLSVS